MNLCGSSKASNHQVLIVDDNPDNLILLQYILEDSGYITYTANCGKIALAMVEAHPPNLIILDLMMPDMNGIEVAEHIRQNPYTQNMPIVLVTGCMVNISNENHKLVNKILSKPFDGNELLSQLDLLIKDTDSLLIN
ncbi:response regulator receiver protein [Calothrix sp. NIES-4071]|nr:response regulator receiver protein [Calothrix sp. NIES-4071]BAZ57801.1 response regulator receiver protein [Calothrix sp. NIES-4105]